MSRWSRAVSLRKPAATGRPSGYDPMAGLFMGSAMPVNGRFEVSTADLNSVAQNIAKSSAQVFALMEWRRRAFSDVRFQWQSLQNGTPGDLYGTESLAPLEVPWPNGTTKDLLNRMIQDADLVGNCYITHHPTRAGRLRRLRPDWVFTVWGSDEDPELFGDALDAELLGYVYAPRTRGMFEPSISQILLPEDVAHFAPTPDPEAYGMGMSWMTPLIKEIGTDLDLVEHKRSFFRNGASPRMAVKVDESVSPEDFTALVAQINRETTGSYNAYRTLYLAGGADPVPMNFNLKDADFGKLSGAGEVRLANAAGVPAPVAGLSQALQGSSLNAGNLKAEIGLFIDLTIRDLWAKAAGTLESILPPQDKSRLWYDTRSTALTQDADAAAERRAQDATTLNTLDMAGYTAESAVAYIASGDPKQLKHTGLTSAQRRPGQNGGGDPATAGQQQSAPADTTTNTDTSTTEGE